MNSIFDDLPMNETPQLTPSSEDAILRKNLYNPQDVLENIDVYNLVSTDEILDGE